MATTISEQALSHETVEQLNAIFDKVFTEGQQWIKSIGVTDWRKTHYLGARARRNSGTGPSVEHVANAVKPVLDYMAKTATTQTGATHNYIIVKPDNSCLNEGGIALIRPVLKCNTSNEPRLNFHVWFHCMPAANPDDHLMVGWRLEGPEGHTTTHNFFHAQPLRKYGSAEKGHGLPDRYPERFPTIPLPATDIVELCLTAILVACGKDAIGNLVRHSSNAKVRASANAFYTKVFGLGAQPAAVLAGC
jgi:hypothetical protein